MRRDFSRLALVASVTAALVPGPAGAELPSYYRSARVMAMGGAGVALADDEAAVYMNPAAMANVREMSFHYANIDLDAAGNLYTDYPAVTAAFSNFTTSSVNELMGRNTYVRAQVSPTLVMPNFGVGVLLDSQQALYARNTALPRVTLGYQQTMGFQAAYGVSLNGSRGRRRKGSLNLGIGAKVLWRRGGYEQLSIAELNALTAAGQSGLGQFAGNYGMGIGADAGLQWVRKVARKFTLHAGASYMNIGDTSFLNGAEPVTGNLTAGVGGVYETKAMKLLFAIDHSHINKDLDWRLKNHLGTELRLPGFSIYGGINQVYLTYGVGFDLWLFDVTAMSYGEELGETAFQEANRRYMVRFGLKFDL